MVQTRTLYENLVPGMLARIKANVTGKEEYVRIDNIKRRGEGYVEYDTLLVERHPHAKMNIKSTDITSVL